MATALLRLIACSMISRYGSQALAAGARPGTRHVLYGEHLTIIATVRADGERRIEAALSAIGMPRAAADFDVTRGTRCIFQDARLDRERLGRGVSGGHER
jgi:hypothetical protein